MAIDKGVVQRHFFINNCFGSFFRGTLSWFGDVFYKRLIYRVLGSYDKSVEYFNKKKQFDREIDTNILPSLTLDPSYDFEPSEPGGKFLWRHAQYAPGLAKKLWMGYEGFEDQSLDVVPVFSRYKGTFDLIFWLNSVYELLDIRTYLFQWSGGYNRLFRPTFFDSFIVVPDTLINHQIEGDIPIDWSKSPMTVMMVDNTARIEHTLPVCLTPWYKFTSISDSSTKYGNDSVAEYKLTASVEYEVEIPTYLVLSTYYGDIKTDLDISMGATYSRYGIEPYIDEESGEFFKTVGSDVPQDRFLASNESGDIVRDKTNAEERAFYTFTVDDEDNFDPAQDQYIIIPNPFATEIDPDYIKVVTYVGELNYGDQWTYSDSGSNIVVAIEPLEGEIVEFFRYSQP